jgi:hypothetical protein
MASMKGRSEVSSYMNSLPEKLVSRVLRGAGRAGAKVIADEVKERSVSTEVADAVIIRSRTADYRIVVRVTIKKGWAYSRALWLEYGTAPHFISVDDSQRGGRGIGRINRQVREAGGEGSLVINGQFVGKTVWHPGARPHPFLRVSLDIKEGEAIQAAQQYINARVTRSGITGQEVSDDE